MDRAASILALAVALLAPVSLAAQGSPEPAEPASEPSQLLVQTGHLGPVLAMEYDASRSLLFTAGSDGILRIWASGARELVGQIGLGTLAAISIAVNPREPRVAVLQGDGARAFAVSVWDWEQGSLQGRVTLAQEPLFMRWSEGGSWLVLGEPKWQSLRLIGSDGRDVPFHPEGFGIVGYAEVSRSERTMMTYLTAGRIQYWDIATGVVQKEVRTAAYLTDLRVSADRRYAAGTDGTEVLLIDLVTGAVKARLAVAGVQSLDLAPGGDQIACVAPGPAGPELSRWSLAGSDPVRLADPAAPEGVSAVRLASDAVFAAGASGSILTLTGGQWNPIAGSVLAGPTGIAAVAGTLAIASPRWIWLLPASRLESGELGWRAPLAVRNPLDSAAGLSPFGDRLVVWASGEGGPAAVLLDPSTGATLRQLTGLPAPLVELEQFAAGGGLELLALDQAGTVRVIDPADGRTIYQSWLPGTLRVAALGRAALVAGRTPLGSEGPLLRIDTTTGEQVAVPSRSRVIYDLLDDQERGFLYAIGASSGSTALLRYRVAGLADETMLMLLDVEDLGAELALDRSTGALYGSLGAGGVASWSADGRQGTLVAAGRVPRKLAAGGGLVASVNQDGSVSLWDASAPGAPAELYLLATGGWCLALPDGRYAGSDDAVALVRVVRSGQVVTDAASLRIPAQ